MNAHQINRIGRQGGGEEQVESSMNGLAELIRGHARNRPEAIALIFEGRETGYGAFDRNASRYQGAVGRLLHSSKPTVTRSFCVHWFDSLQLERKP